MLSGLVERRSKMKNLYAFFFVSLSLLIGTTYAQTQLEAERHYSFESYNYPNYFIRHKNYLGEITEVVSVLDRKDSTFKIVTGLANRHHVSLESVNYPGYYLRHHNFRLKLYRATNDQLFKKDATFKILKGLAAESWNSFESYNYPGYFIRHRNFHLYLEKDNSDIFRADATFKPKTPNFSPYENIKRKYYSFESYISYGAFICDPLNEESNKLAHVWSVKDSKDSKQATFKIVSGLSDNRHFSFESLLSPEHYLRDWGFFAKIDKKSGDFEYMKGVTFKIIPALTGDPFPYISIESHNRPMKYLYTMWPDDQYSHLLGIGQGSSEEFKKLATFRLEIQVTNPPTRFTLKSKNPKDSEWGSDISSEEIQGITHSDTHWYISNKGTIYKTRKNQIKSVVKKVDLSSIQSQLKAGDYNHFGDMDFYDGLLYIATTGKGSTHSIVVVFDKNLNFVKYAKFPARKQKKAGWVAINPVTGYLYSSDQYRQLHVYKKDFSNGSVIEALGDLSLNFKYGAPNEEEWGKVWNQGGAFSPHGIFYYVLDHKSDEYCNYTGIHAFSIHGSYANEITIKGKNNKNENVSFMNEKYDPDIAGYRNWELEGITTWDRGAEGQIHVLQLHNEWYNEDDVHLFHYKVNNEY
jgi:hypothetical protein